MLSRVSWLGHPVWGHPLQRVLGKPTQYLPVTPVPPEDGEVPLTAWPYSSWPLGAQSFCLFGLSLCLETEPTGEKVDMPSGRVCDFCCL